MKKLEPRPNCTKFTRDVVLFREDVEEVVALLRAHVGEVTIADSTYEYENLEELRKERGESIRELRITSDAPEFGGSVTASFEGGRIAVTDALRTGSWELKAGLDQVLTRGKKLHLRILEPFLWWGLSVLSYLVGGLVFGLALIYAPGQSSEVLVMVTLAIVLVHLMWLGSGIHAKKRAALVLVRRHERQGFLRRNWDKIVLLVIGALLGLLLDFFRRAFGG